MNSPPCANASAWPSMFSEGAT
uniref:Uncharacterized protein n=1 Tax=Arundo donax TaxID=35708 RepID=A0A0A8ZC43_ARUDO